MNILLAGVSGFVGRHLSDFFSRKGIRGIGVGRSECGKVPEGWIWANRSRMLSGNSDLPFKLDCLIHLEVKHHVPQPTSEDIKSFREVNVHGLQQWLDWCEQCGIKRVISFSTIKSVQSAETLLDETAPGPGDSHYGASKWEAEQIFSKWISQDTSRSGVVVRPAVIYGPGNLANMFSFVSAIHRGRYFSIGDSDNVKSLVSLLNVVSAVHFLSERMDRGFHIYNLVDADNYTVSELASMIARAFGKEDHFRSLPAWFAHMCAHVGDVLECGYSRVPLTTRRLRALTESSAFSCQKLIQEGFKHPQTTEEGIAELVDWYLKEGKDKSAIHQ